MTMLRLQQGIDKRGIARLRAVGQVRQEKEYSVRLKTRASTANRALPIPRHLELLSVYLTESSSRCLARIRFFPIRKSSIEEPGPERQKQPWPVAALYFYFKD